MAEEEKKRGGKTYHITQRQEDGMWQVKLGGGQKALKRFRTQKEAIDYAEKVSGNQEGSIRVHRKDGKIRKK